ncbi:hypothetical protein HKT18_06360 [Flavobacterium sp. IMCC34852]|uniref:Lipoprotein n=1 Tax=Flavobacterium rivulicola TaxID=2732161 RepID=A0A7Y3VYL9_9FLAO|nr:hypothetical protein [Flavobacterium sp. IMCC34852]NNT71835.1 hypothetical protein [Flavobacterium sp. IMCC34852]
MKKILVLLLLFCFLTSCGPRRLGCGPSRCDIEKPTLDIVPLKNIC